MPKHQAFYLSFIVGVGNRQVIPSLLKNEREAVAWLVTLHQAKGQFSKRGSLLVCEENSSVLITVCLVIIVS